MNALRRLLLASFTLAPLLAAAQSHDHGAEFTVLKPEQPVENTGRIEVVEFFWYGCPHCYQLEPLLEKWVPKLPADVIFSRVPAILNQRWARDAGIYYTFEALGLTEKLHRPLFDAIHRERLRTDDQQAVAAWLRQHGVDPSRFEQTLKSFGVQSRIRRASQLSVSYKLEGVPTLAIHGRYTVEAGHGRTFEEMLRIADGLIATVRKDIGPKGR